MRGAAARVRQGLLALGQGARLVLQHLINYSSFSSPVQMTVGGGFGAAQARGGLVAADDDEEETEAEKAKRLRRERKASLAEGMTKAVFCGVCKLETPQHCVCLQEAALKAKRAEDREWREK